MSIIAKLSIFKRILLLSIIPLLGLILVCSFELYTSFHAYKDAKIIEKIIGVSPKISNAIHELQKERGRSAGFLSSKGAKFSDSIGPARKSSDKALSVYNNIPVEELGILKNEHYTEPHKKSKAMLAQLEDMRKKVDSHSLTVPQMASFYTGLITNLLKEVESIEYSTADAQLVRPMIAYNALSQAKEYAGLERAMGAVGFGTGAFKQKIYNNLISFIGKQNAKFSSFKQHTDKGDLTTFESLQKSKASLEVQRLRAIATAGPFGGELYTVTVGQWFNATTLRINELKKFEDKIGEGLIQLSKDFSSTASRILYLYIAIVCALILITALLSYWVSQSIISQLHKMTNLMRSLSRDDTTSKIFYLNRKDELGKMAKTIDIFRNNSIERNKLRAEAIVERDKEAHKQSYISSVIEKFRDVEMNIRHALKTQTESMMMSAGGLNTAAETVSENAALMKTSSSQAAGNVEVVANSTKELSNSMKEIASQIHKAEEIVRETSITTSKTDEEISTLSQAAEKIGNVVELVRNIAEQTNLLALNATIEAARAGDAGKGFAVVAQEVKALSDQTAKATDEIVSQISAVQSSSSGTISAIKTIMEHIDEISEVTVSITSAIEEQQTAASKIAQSIEIASQETNKVTENVDNVNTSIQAAFKETNNVQESSTALVEVSEELSKAVTDFLNDVGEDVKNRRAALRKQVNRIAVISQDGNSHDFMIEDATENGAYITGSKKLGIGSEFEINLSDGRHVEATVVRQDERGFGVQFKEKIPNITCLTEGLEETPTKKAS